MDGPLVLVTGASGFIASHIVQQLLADGHRVRGTVRDPRRLEPDGPLNSLPGASERLELVAADLTVPGSFDEAVRGCDYVLHTASPYILDADDPQRDIVEPAVNGTLSVLEACRAADGVRRVVVTSSVAAITDQADGHLNTEDDWNTRSSLTRNPYYYSKTLAERAAWAFVESNRPRFDLVVLNPFFVVGPSLIPALNISHQPFRGLTNGSVPGIIALEWGLVDVRDVARAHLLAMSNPAANGRHILAAGVRSMRQVVDLLRENGWDDRYRLPSLPLDGPLASSVIRFVAGFVGGGTGTYLHNHVGGRMRFDNTKSISELGLDYRDVDQTVLDAMEDLDLWGHLGRRRRGSKR